MAETTMAGNIANAQGVAINVTPERRRVSQAQYEGLHTLHRRKALTIACKYSYLRAWQQ